MSTGKIGKSQIRPVSGLSPGVLLPVRTYSFARFITDNTADTLGVDTRVSCKDRLHSNTVHNVNTVPSA
jgi:hypothetical protein